MKTIVRINEKFVVFKQYTHGDRAFARPILECDTMREAYKYLQEDEGGSCVPANNISSGGIAGTDIGYTKKKKYKFFDKLARRKAP